MRSICFLLAFCSSAVFAAPENGEFKNDGSDTVWHQPSNEWLTPINFWRSHADSKGGLTWGEGRTYPDYDSVKEHDTFLVEVDSGSCLMEFFHSRWRRANDVWRWDERFNAYGGCPDVFR